MLVEEGGRATASRSQKPHSAPGNRSMQPASQPFTPKATLPTSWQPQASRPMTAAPGSSRPPAQAQSFGTVLQDIAAAGANAAAPGFDPNAVRDDRTKLAAAEIGGSTPSAAEQHAGTAFRYAAKSRADITEDRAREAKDNLATAERALRAHAIGADTDTEHGQVQQMTWEQYNNLSASERAAVDFNTMLVRAVNRDTKLQGEYDPNKLQRATYDKAVEGMFGEDGASKTYAPETMAVLRQIDFKDDSAALDDFLSLKAAITSEDLKKNLDTVTGFWTHDNANTVQVDKQQLTQTLAEKTMSMQDALAKGNHILATMNQTSLVDRNEDVSRFLGGIAKGPADILGYGEAKVDPNTGAPQDLNTYFQQAFDTLADKGNQKNTKQILTSLNQDLSPSELDTFMSYANQRSANAERYGVDLGDAKGVKYQSPAEFRKMLGSTRPAAPAAEKPAPAQNLGVNNGGY